jgi:hypothetical protein
MTTRPDRAAREPRPIEATEWFVTLDRLHRVAVAQVGRAMDQLSLREFDDHRRFTPEGG